MSDTTTQPPVPQPEKEVTSTANHIQLLTFKPEAFAGIDPSRNIILHLNEAPIIGIEGDQGTFKTSMISCIIAHLGGEEISNSQHAAKDAGGKTTYSRKSSLTFVNKKDPSVTYESKVGKSSITIKKMEDVDGTIVTSNINAPKEFLWNTFGPIGLSPMQLKEMNGKKQIEWIRKLYKFTAEQAKQEEVIKVKYKNKFTERTAVNNDMKRLFTELSGTQYFSWDKENGCYVPTELKASDEKFVKDNSEDEAAINSKFELANKNMQLLTAANTRLDQRKLEKKTIEGEIEELRKKLEAKQLDLAAKDKEIEVGAQYVKDLEKAPQELEDAKKKMQDIGEVKLKKSNLATADNKLVQYNDKEQKQIQLTADLDELKIERKNFIKQFTPDIPGLELVVNDGIDEEKEEGMYYNERTPQELSESMLWDLYIQILRAVNCHFVCIENLSSLGSEAIDRLNWFVKEGHGQVFYTAMQRGVKEMKITMHTDIK